jgi:hypothetical protein
VMLGTTQIEPSGKNSITAGLQRGLRWQAQPSIARMGGFLSSLSPCQ